jgi:hypothetical protein
MKWIPSKPIRHACVLQSLPLIESLYVNGVWFGEDWRIDASDNALNEEVDNVQICDVLVDRVGFKGVESALGALHIMV